MSSTRCEPPPPPTPSSPSTRRRTPPVSLRNHRFQSESMVLRGAGKARHPSPVVDPSSRRDAFGAYTAGRRSPPPALPAHRRRFHRTRLETSGFEAKSEAELDAAVGGDDLACRVIGLGE